MLSNLNSLAWLAVLFHGALSTPVKRQDSAFTYYDLTTPLAGPCDLATGPDGNIWGDTFLSNKFVKVDRKTGVLTEYDIPYTLPIINDTIPAGLQGRITGSCVVRTGKDGRVYGATGIRNQLARINITTGYVEIFNTGNPLGNLEPFNDAWPGDTGMFFSQTTGNVISLFDYETTLIKNYEVPTPLAGPLGMRIAADGALWFTEFFASKIGRLNITDGTIKEYDLPPSLLAPTVMRAETEGRYLFFTCIVANAIGRIDIYTGEIKTYEVPTLLSLPTEDTTDSKGNVWFSTADKNQLNYLNPVTGEFTSIDQPDASLLTGLLPSLIPAVDIAINYVEEDNTMWFTELLFNRIGRYQIPS